MAHYSLKPVSSQSTGLAELSQQEADMASTVEHDRGVHTKAPVVIPSETVEFLGLSL